MFVAMTGKDSLGMSLQRLLKGADMALGRPVGDAAWNELARIIEVENAVLDAQVGVEGLDVMRARVVADAECIRASIVAARALKGSAVANAQRRTVRFCRGMRSEVERLTFALQAQRSPDPRNAAPER
ncbi:MAG: hypothetical protein Q8M19_10105 [Reyranella sp.]|nr:hypothetical protein [Reyranella sp.]